MMRIGGRLTRVLGAAATLVAAGLAFSGGASAHPPVTVGEEVPVTGNPTCAEFDPSGLLTEFKIEAPTSGSYSDGNLTVDLSVYQTAEGWYLDWIEYNTTLEVHSVVVKGGSGGGYVYLYDGTADADGGLHASMNKNGKFAEVSHVSFCYTENYGGS